MAASPAYDIAIAGAGFVGISLALALSSGENAANAPFSVALIDPIEPKTAAQEKFDGRALFYSPASKILLRYLGVWQKMEPHAEPVHDLLITDGQLERGPSSLHLHFGEDLMPDNTGGGNGASPIGYMVENRHTRIAFNERLAEVPAIKRHIPDKVTGFEAGPATASLQLETGAAVTATLAIAADGRNSRLRTMAGIKTITHSYKQKNIVTIIEHEKPHNGIAHDYFLPGGSFAILPLQNNRAAIAWTEPEDIADTIMAMDDAGFAHQLQKRVGDFLGAIKPVDQPQCYPLGLMLAHDYVTERLALAGDCAHAIHPLAGQGLNMGLRDVAALVDVIRDTRRLGLDIGSQMSLERYQAWRRFDNTAMAGFMDGLNRVFANNNPLLRMARDLMLDGINRISPLKAGLIKAASGRLGKIPSLMTPPPSF